VDEAESVSNGMVHFKHDDSLAIFEFWDQEEPVLERAHRQPDSLLLAQPLVHLVIGRNPLFEAEDLLRRHHIEIFVAELLEVEFSQRFHEDGPELPEFFEALLDEEAHFVVVELVDPHGEHDVGLVKIAALQEELVCYEERMAVEQLHHYHVMQPGQGAQT